MLLSKNELNQINMEVIIQKNLLQEFITELEQKAKNNSVTPDDFKTALYHIKDAKFKIQSLLDLLQENDTAYKNLHHSNYLQLPSCERG